MPWGERSRKSAPESRPPGRPVASQLLLDGAPARRGGVFPPGTGTGAHTGRRFIRQVMNDVTDLHGSGATVEEGHERDDRHDRQDQRQRAGHVRDEEEARLTQSANRAEHDEAVREGANRQAHDALLAGVTQKSLG